MVPRTQPAHFDGVGDMVAGSFCESSELASQADAAPMARQSRAEHIRHVHQTRSLTDWAVAGDGRANFACGSNELGVSITHFASINETGAIVGQP